MDDILKCLLLTGAGFAAGVYVSSYITGVDQKKIYGEMKYIIVNGKKKEK